MSERSSRPEAFHAEPWALPAAPWTSGLAPRERALEHGERLFRRAQNMTGVKKTMEKLRLRPEFERVDIYFNDPVENVEAKTFGLTYYELMPYVIKCFYELNNFDAPDFVYTSINSPNFPVNGIILTERCDTEALQNMMKNGVSSFKLVYYQTPEFVGYEVLPSYSTFTLYYNADKRNILKTSGVKNAIDNFGTGINGLINVLKNPKTFYHLNRGIVKRIFDDLDSLKDMKEQLQGWIDDLENRINEGVINNAY